MHKPALIRGDANFGNEPALREAEPEPEHHREAITSRPLLFEAIGRQTRHAGRTTVTVTSRHGEHHRARRALSRIAAFFAELRKTAEQLSAIER